MRSQIHEVFHVSIHTVYNVCTACSRATCLRCDVQCVSSWLYLTRTSLTVCQRTSLQKSWSGWCIDLRMHLSLLLQVSGWLWLTSLLVCLKNEQHKPTYLVLLGLEFHQKAYNKSVQYCDIAAKILDTAFQSYTRLKHSESYCSKLGRHTSWKPCCGTCFTVRMHFLISWL